MQLVGQAIIHNTFGKGIVTGITQERITVIFSQGEKKFLYPDAFQTYLTLKDQRLQKNIDNMLTSITAEKERKEADEQKEQARLDRIRKLKITPTAQAAFGFLKNTSDQVFQSWRVSTGVYLTGPSKGEPRVPSRLKLNSACLLTERPMGEPEKARKIIGAFMVSDDFHGSACKNGVIRSHDKYRIQLEQAERLPFWRYFAPDDPAPRWGNTEIRYFSNKTMQGILRDMQKGISDPERRQAAGEFYRYFSLLNQLT